MNFIETALKDSFIIEPSIFEDKRGYFFEGYSAKEFFDKTGQSFNIVQLNFSKSSKGVLRGLHFQKDPKAQAKLISVVAGQVWDVAVDLRKESPNYMQWHGEIISAENRKRFFIPKGFAHGFIAMSDSVELMYAVDNLYSFENDAGINYNDPTLNIDWKLRDVDIILSEKDKKLPQLYG